MNLEISPVSGLPEVRPGMDLAQLLLDALDRSSVVLAEGDILAVTQKIVSKAEGQIVRLADIEPSDVSRSVASELKKDPRVIEVVLRESRRIVRMRGEVLICETHHGFICANAGVDRSNLEDSESVTLLPKNPDRSAAALSRRLGCGIIITDTFGRPWREGLVDVAIGFARVPPLLDYRGQPDAYGHTMNVTVLAVVDALAAGAGLVMGKTNGTPAALIRGFPWEESKLGINSLLRDQQKDLFL
jgi:coenzyme F420-0:L-glutamate ligase/coenzyme F420-1:gamma-L-glutamate ligase